MFILYRQSGAHCLSSLFINLSVSEQRVRGQRARAGFMNPAYQPVFVTAIVTAIKQRTTNISVTLIGMPQHYQSPREKNTAPKCIRCISEILPDFSMNLAPVFRARPEAKPLPGLCASSQKRGLRVCLNGEGTETSAV